MSREPGAVVLRTGRGALVVMLAAVGFVLVGLVAALGGAVLDGGRFDVDGTPSSPAATLLLWVLLLPLALLLAVAVVLLLRAIAAPTTEVLSPSGYRRERRGRVEVDVRRQDLTGVRFRPAAQATWQGSDAADPSVRGVGRTRLHNRIELRSPQATVELTDTRAWPEQVEVVRAWVRDRPELLDADPDSHSFLLATRSTPSSAPAEPLPGWPVGLVALAVRRRDPWAPFLPDDYGRYSALFNGRYTVARASRRGSVAGLLARWVFLALWFAPFAVLAWLVVRLLSVVA